MNQLNSWKIQYALSFKSPEVEDFIDTYFYRPAGFFFAKIGQNLHLSPSVVTLFGTILGVLSAFNFYHSTFYSTVLASILFLFSGILDSADGQLARITNQASSLGRVLDGLGDNIVFASIYISCTLVTAERLGGEVWILAVMAGISHFLQSSVLDFYTESYLNFVIRKPSAPKASSAISERKFIDIDIEKLWKLPQEKFSGRTNELSKMLYSLSSSNRAPSFRKRYRYQNRAVLAKWRVLGANTHTAGIILSMLFQRFEFYLLFEIVLLNAWFIYVRKIQIDCDGKLKDLIL